MSAGIIYLIRRQSEFEQDIPIYKLGSCDSIYKMIEDNPNKFVLHTATFVSNIQGLKNRLMELFNDYFIVRNELGPDYFYGSVHKMMQFMKTVIDYYYQISAATVEKKSMEESAIIQLLDAHIRLQKEGITILKISRTDSDDSSK